MNSVPVVPAPASLESPVSEKSARDPGFVDRRRSVESSDGRSERRQFASSHSGLSPDAQEFATAIDRYKLLHRRRYITCEEMLKVLHELGYEKVR
ncbi:MAG: hypothetical protein AAFP90_00465 [Planctomycetota bacterium]